MKLMYKYLCGGGFLALLVMLSACQTVPITGRQQIIMVSDAEMNSMAVSTYHQMISKSPKCTNSAINQQVSRVGNDLANATMKFLRANNLPTDNYAWEFNVIKADDVVNAGCLPGGKIIVWTGILPITETDTGLAAVLGHEIAHAVAKHGNERMSQRLATGLVASVVSEVAEKDAMAIFGFGAQFGVLMPFSRLHEAEADEIGLHIMALAGYDPREAVDLWYRMAEKGGPRPPEFMSSHPAPENRAEKIRSLLPIVMPIYLQNKSD